MVFNGRVEAQRLRSQHYHFRVSSFPKKVIWEIKQAVHKHRLKIKADKELSLIDSPAAITGVIVAGNQTKLPNRQLRRLFELGVNGTVQSPLC